MPAPRTPAWLRKPLLLLALMAGTLPACLAADAPQRWQLVFFHPFRPGVLALCANAHLRSEGLQQARPDAADPLKAWVVDAALRLRWQGGELVQSAPAPTPALVPTPAQEAPPPRATTDLCFMLWRDGRPLVSGAVVPQQSARQLRFPTLVRMAPATDTPVRYELLPAFPATLADPVPPAWAALGP